MTRSFDVFFDLRLNKWLSKQPRGWWFETPSRPLWRHCNASNVSTGSVKYHMYIWFTVMSKTIHDIWHNHTMWLTVIFHKNNHDYIYGPLARCAKLRVAHAPGMPATFSPPPRVSDPDMYHGTCVTHVPWCMPGSLTSGFYWSWRRGKRSRYSRRMRNPQFYVSGKRPMEYSNSYNVLSIKRAIRDEKSLKNLGSYISKKHTMASKIFHLCKSRTIKCKTFILADL